MTQTLTTERLKQIRHSFIAERDANADIGRPSYDEAIAIMDELLANREAQPVASECDQDVYANGTSACLVVIPKETAEVICRGISAVTGCKVDWHYIGGRVHIKAIDLPVPAVPEEMTGSIAMTQYRIKPSNYKQWVKGYNACRAAMLAAAPEGGNEA